MRRLTISLCFNSLLSCALYASSNSDINDPIPSSLSVQKKAEIRTREEIRQQKMLYLHDDLAKAWKSTLESFYEMQLKEFEVFKIHETLTYIQSTITFYQETRNKELRRCCHRKDQGLILEQYKQKLNELLVEIQFREMNRWAKTTRKESLLIKQGFEACGFDPEVYNRVLYLKNEEWIFKSFESIESIRVVFQGALSENEIRRSYVQSGRLDSLNRKFRRFIKSGKNQKPYKEHDKKWRQD